MEATPTHMKLHTTRKNLARSVLDHEPSAHALDSSSFLPFITPLRPRWSPVVFQRKTPSISLPFIPLRHSSSHNEGGYPPPITFSPRLRLLEPLPIPLTPLLCYPCALFCTANSRNCFRFNYFHTLLQKPPGVRTSLCGN